MDPSVIEPYLTVEQTKVASLIHLTTAPLSVFGSGFIIYSIWKDRKLKMRRAYQRLMLGLSIMDLISSLSLVLTMPWLAPSELGNELVYQAYGNFTTCVISGFFFNFMQGASCYSVCLALFFLSQVRYEMREAKFAKRLEPAFHAVSILMPLVQGILGFLGELLNPVTKMPGLCWVQEYPTGCVENEDIPCIRGERAKGENLFIGLSTAVNFVMIIGTQRGMIRTRQTGRQALMYIVAYFSWFFPFVPVNVLEGTTDRGDPKFFIAVLFLRTVSPLQGFLNFLIYRRRMGGAETRRSTVSNVRPSSSPSSRLFKSFSKQSGASADLSASDGASALRGTTGLRNNSTQSANLATESIDELEEEDIGSVASESKSVAVVKDGGGDTDGQLGNSESGRHVRVDMTGSIEG
ncbi:MAG: hypothetical protein SGBAC_007129 [Bacillariaceae sp.]